MKHISEIIDDILVDWAYRVHDGMPDINNPLHIANSKETMEKLDLPNDFIFEFIQNLFEDDGGRKKKLAKKMGL